MNRTAQALAALAWFLALAGAATAQQADQPAAPPPDKSGFTLFNPTPDADLRSFCADRPTKSTGPCTVDAGHLQFESDIANVTWATTGGVDTTSALYTNPTLKLGLTNTLDVEINIAPYQTVTSKDRTSGITTRGSGVGDLFLRAKLNLLGDDSGSVAIALEPFVKIPTAPKSVGNGAVEEGVLAPIQFTLPDSWTLALDPEADGLKNALDDGQHLNIQTPISFGRPISKTVTGFVELWLDENFEPSGHTTQASFDLAAAWIPAKRPNFQLDGGVNLGLNTQTPGVQAYVGVSQRF
jgi:hypothetical protein